MKENALTIFFLSAPILAVSLIFLIIECCRKERPDARPGRMPAVLLLLLALGAAAGSQYHFAAVILAFAADGKTNQTVASLLWMAEMAAIVLAVHLIWQLIARLLKLIRKKRIISVLFLTLFMLCTVLAFAVYDGTIVIK